MTEQENQHIEAFMTALMFLLEKSLNKEEGLKTVTFHSDESNLDRPLKEFLRLFITTRYTTLPVDSGISSVTQQDTTTSYTDFSQVKIQRVLLPEDITLPIKQSLKAQHTTSKAFTNPDLCLELTLNGNTHYKTIELKTTKGDTIPGSSIQQVDPYEWVIFIQHTATTTQVSTMQYMHALNEQLAFPDRSPRPSVSIKRGIVWNSNHRSHQNNDLSYKQDPDDEKRINILNNWEEALADDWVSFFTQGKKSTWFNRVLQNYTFKILRKFQAMTLEEQEELLK